MLTYDEARESGLVITRSRAIREVLDHWASVAEFLEDVGDRETYTSRELLAWLGY